MNTWLQRWHQPPPGKPYRERLRRQRTMDPGAWRLSKDPAALAWFLWNATPPQGHTAARAFAQTLGEKGDILQYPSKKRGETAAVFNELAFSLAVLAFCPGGVRFCGRRWVGRICPGGTKGDPT